VSTQRGTPRKGAKDRNTVIMVVFGGRPLGRLNMTSILVVTMNPLKMLTTERAIAVAPSAVAEWARKCILSTAVLPGESVDDIAN